MQNNLLAFEGSSTNNKSNSSNNKLNTLKDPKTRVSISQKINTNIF
jgi:hypothetical protein